MAKVEPINFKEDTCDINLLLKLNKIALVFSQIFITSFVCRFWTILGTVVGFGCVLVLVAYLVWRFYLHPKSKGRVGDDMNFIQTHHTFSVYISSPCFSE